MSQNRWRLKSFSILIAAVFLFENPMVCPVYALAPRSPFAHPIGLGDASEFGLHSGSENVAGDFVFTQGPVLGQWREEDKKSVVGYANKPWFSDQKIARFNQQGVFVFDIDKTIAGRDRKLLEDMVQTIQNLMRSGHLVTIITGQPMFIQRQRIVAPIAPELRQNLIVTTNEGAVAHHFFPNGDEYIVLNDATKQWYYTEEELAQLKGIVEEFVEERGIEYAPGEDGPPDNRENVQLSFKIEAGIKTRLAYKDELEEKFRQKGLKDFQCTVSGATTMSLWKKGIAKNTSGIGFLRASGLQANRMTYFGDEFFRYGNDECMLEEKDLLICAVGRYDAMLEKRAGAVFVGAGPDATQSLLNDFLVSERKEQLRPFTAGHVDYKDLMHDVAMRHTDWETLAQSYEGSAKGPGEILKALQASWIIADTPFARLMERLLASPIQKGDFKRLLTEDAKAQLQVFDQILKEYRVGALFVTALYQAAFGNRLEEDFEGMANELENALPPEGMPAKEMVGYREKRKGMQNLRDTCHLFSGILEEYLGAKTTGDLRYSIIDRLMGQDTDWVANMQTLLQTRRATLKSLSSVKDALKKMVQPHGAYPWLLRVFEGRLPLFHRHVDVTAEPPPSITVGQADDAEQGAGGIVGFGGGGGSRLLGQVLLDSMVHSIVLPGYENLPFTMTVPSEDDGGSSFNIDTAFLRRYGVKLPAMGDDRNASSGLTLGQPNRFNEPHFRFIYDVFRHRFPDEGVGSVDSELFQIAYAQIQAMQRSKIVFDDKDWQRLVSFLLHVFDVLMSYDLMELRGNSLGNIYWTAYHTKTGAIPIRPESARNKTTVTMSEDLFVKGQRGMAKAIGLGNMLVLPSNLNPGTLYVLMKDMEVFRPPDKQEKPELIPVPPQGKTIQNKIIHAGGHAIALREEDDLGAYVDKDKSQTYATTEIAEGESLFVTNRGTTFTLEAGTESALFRTEIRKIDGVIRCRHTVGAEKWGPWQLLTRQETAVGVADNKELAEKAVDQIQWGARVALADDGKVRITLDRLGAKTMLKWPKDRAQASLKSRIIVRQTKITETYHHTKIMKAGMIEGKIPQTYDHFLKMIDKAKVGVVIGPASVVTSIIPILMIKEVRDALKRKAAEGIPVIFVVNATKDNETASDTVSSLFTLIEDSVGERVFGAGGFVTDIIANDARDIPENLLPLIDLTDSKTTKLRPAERPRGVLGLTREEEEDLSLPHGRNLRIHQGALLTSMQREVRGGVPEESVGYDTVRLGRLIETAILARNLEKLRESPDHKRILAIFRGSERALSKAIHHALASGHLRGQLEALALIRTQYEAKRPLTQEVLKQHAPRVMIGNLAHTILPGRAEVITQTMGQRLNEYFEAGGYLVVVTGLEWNKAISNLFGPGSVLEPRFKERIFLITTSGGELRRADGLSLLDREAPPIPDTARKEVQTVLAISRIHPPELRDRGSLLAIVLPQADTTLNPEDVEAFNQLVRRDPSLTPEEKSELIIRWVPGVEGTYDLRNKIVEILNERFKKMGLDILAEDTGRATVDIRWKDVSEAKALATLLGKTDQPLAKIDPKDMLIVGRGASTLASEFPEILTTLLPDTDPRTVFLANALPLELVPGQRNPEWNPQTFEQVLAIATKALKTPTPIERAGEEMLTAQDGRILRAQLLDGTITAEEFIRKVMKALDRESLIVPDDIARPKERYRFGGLLLKDMDTGMDPDTNLRIRRLTTDIALLKRAIEDKKIASKFEEAISVFLSLPDVQDWSSFEALEVTLEIIRIAALDDPDKVVKAEMRAYAFSLLDKVCDMVSTAEDSLDAALRLSVIGNSLDLQDPRVQMEMANNPYRYLSQRVDREFFNPNFWARTDLEKVKQKLEQGPKHIVFVFDNAGEDVLDFLLIQELLKQGHKVTLAAKSKPAANDTTEDDVKRLLQDERIKALIGKYAGQLEVIGTGTIAQGTDLMRIFPSFRQAWNKADLVIFKGQANYFTVRNDLPTKDCLYLLKVKWPPEVAGRYDQGNNVAEYVEKVQGQQPIPPAVTPGPPIATMDDVNVQEKTVLVRPDLNVPAEKGHIKNIDAPETRVIEHAKTLKELSDKGAKVVVVFHQGRPGEPDYMDYPDEHAAQLSALIGKEVKHVNDLFGEQAVHAIQNLKPGEILLLKPVRSLDPSAPSKTLEANPAFVGNLEPLVDLFVLDGFSVAHRDQASVTGFTKTPAVAGRVMQRELEMASGKLVHPPQPHLLIVGGGKVPEKLGEVIGMLESGKASKVILGGRLGNLAIVATQPGAADAQLPQEQYRLAVQAVGQATADDLKKYLGDVPRLAKVIADHKEKVKLPTDAVYMDGTSRKVENFVEGHVHSGFNQLLVGIGPETANHFARLAAREEGPFASAFVVGPLGDDRYPTKEETKTVLEAVSRIPFWYTGGGNTESLVREMGFIPSYTSLAGGALNEFKRGQELPGIKILEKNHPKLMFALKETELPASSIEYSL